MRGDAGRYTIVAVVLHWTIAVAIAGNIFLGWWMHHAIDDPAVQARAIAAFQLHKSIGLTILLLSVIRLSWRIFNPPPPLPDAMPSWEKLTAKATHWAFYLLLIAIPLSGWLYVSTGWRGEVPLNVPTLWFGLFEIPHLLALNENAPATRQALSGATLEAHELLVWAMAGLLVLHVAAALKHHLIDRDAVLANMLPVIGARGHDADRSGGSWRQAALLGAGAATVCAVGAASLSLVQVPLALPATAPVRDVAVVPEIAAPSPTSAPGEAPAGFAASAAAAPVAAWTIDHAASEIAFTGTNAGASFRGRFTRWRADIRFDRANLEQSGARVTIDTGSATDGVALHDSTLPQAEWFDVARHPSATFRTTRIRHLGGDRYDADGTLNIKGRDIRVPFPFTLAVDGDRAVMTGRIVLDRSGAGLGMQSDPNASWVSREIGVSLRVTAQRKR